MQDEVVDNLNINEIGVKSRTIKGRDKFKTIEHGDLPKIQTPALSSDLREGFSVLPAS